MNKRLLITGLTSLIITYILTQGAATALMEALSTEQLTNLSDTIIRGKTVEVKSRWSRDRKTIYTTAAVTVREVIKGKNVPGTVTVQYRGGETGDTGLRVSDTAALKKGEETILFLRKAKSGADGETYRITGKAQGKYTIDKNGIARKSGFTVIKGKDTIDNNIPADILTDKIRRIMQK